MIILISIIYFNTSFKMNNTIEINDLLLKELIQYFYKGNLNFCLKSADIEKMDWNLQQTFLEATVNSNLLKKFPISPQFTKLFFKKLVEYLEPSQEIHDDIYAHLCTAMKASSEEKFCYRHYIVGKNFDQTVTMKETRNMVVNGTTGLKTWEAALVLSDWALCNKEIFSNKNVLELGSGVGFAGITIGRICDVKSLLLTDCHDEVLQTICENIQINFTNFKRKAADNVILFEDNKKSIGTMLLDWNNIDNLNDDLIPDVIIGADIVYDPTILKPLCKVIKTFCNKNKCLEVYIASVIRNEDTFNRFLNILGTMSFNYEKIEMRQNVYIEWDETVHKCLLKIKLS